MKKFLGLSAGLRKIGNPTRKNKEEERGVVFV